MKRKFAKLKRKNIHFFNEGIAIKREDKYDMFGNHINSFNLQNETIFIKMDIEGTEY